MTTFSLSRLLALRPKKPPHLERRLRGTVAPGAEKTFRCQVGTTWRARRLETNEILLEHRVGAVRLVAEPPEDVHDFGGDQTTFCDTTGARMVW